MELWIVRHARAERRRQDLDDERRALTRRGRREFREAVRGLERLGARFDRVVHSPLLRALETAELLAPLAEAGDDVLAVSSALARAPAEPLLAEISGSARVAVVGHEPWLSQLAGWLVTGWRGFTEDESRSWIELEKGGVARLAGRAEPGGMRVVELHRLDTLRALR